MRYVDTSLLVAALCNEAATDRAQSWLASHDASPLVISDWTVTEMSSAFAVKLRTGDLSIEHRAAALAMFNKLVGESLQVLPVTSSDFWTAARFVDQQVLGLRAGDALHLAVAAHHGATVHTLDKRLADAGPALGVPAHLLV